MKAAVVYFSLEGNTKYIAEFIGRVIGADLIELNPEKEYLTGKALRFLNGRRVIMDPKPKLKPYTFNSKKYDLVILGSPVWSGKIAPPLATFLRDNNLKGKRTAYFLSSISGNGKRAFREFLKLTSKTGNESEGEDASDNLKLSLKSPKNNVSEEQRKELEKFCLALIGNFESDELWDLYDKDRNLTGETIKRGSMIPDGLYHLVITVWLRDSKGRFLMSLRSDKKRWCPGMWEATGGAVDHGESSLEGAVREVREELGIELNPKEGKLIRSTRSEEMRDFYDVWLFDIDETFENITLQKSEVAEARFMTTDEIDNLWNEGKLHVLLHYYKEVFEQSL